MKDFRVKLSGKRWVVRYVTRLVLEGRRIFGIVHYDKREMRIREGQTERCEFGTLFHEFMHVARPNESEEAVCEIEADAKRFFFDHLGYRKPRS